MPAPSPGRCGAPAVFCAALLLGLLQPPGVSAQGNILLIVADDPGVDNVGVYAEGADLPPTAHIDEDKNGMRRAASPTGIP